jgi:hypothetical protein
MRPASDAEYSPAAGVVIAQRRLILSVDLEFPRAFPDIVGGECLGQTETESTAAIPSSLGYIDMASPNAFPRHPSEHERRCILSLSWRLAPFYSTLDDHRSIPS